MGGGGRGFGGRRYVRWGGGGGCRDMGNKVASVGGGGGDDGMWEGFESVKEAGVGKVFLCLFGAKRSSLNDPKRS